jgi:hypothetical protein
MNFECRRGLAGLIGKGKCKSSMILLDGELFDASQETGSLEKTSSVFFGALFPGFGLAM